MREVAKSVFGLSWAVSLYGLQQISKAMASDRQRWDRTAAEIEDVSRVVQSRLADTAAQQFRAGDDWQRRVVDVMFDLASMRSIDPRRMVEAIDPRGLVDSADPRMVVETSVTVMQRSIDVAVDTMRQTAGAAVDAANRALESVRPSAAV